MAPRCARPLTDSLARNVRIWVRGQPFGFVRFPVVMVLYGGTMAACLLLGLAEAAFRRRPR